MKEITKLMVNEFHIKKLGYDFMGYSLQKGDIYTFHHLIVPKRNCRAQGYGEGYFFWNGAILCSTPHQYLHVIEEVDRDMFLYITSEMIDENIQKKLDIRNIRNIHDVLRQFEREHSSDVTSTGKKLIKEQFLHRRKF